MELKEKIISSYVAFENKVDINSAIHDIRSEALENFEKVGFPTKKLESWKYTSLNTILKNDFSIFLNKENTVELADVKKAYKKLALKHHPDRGGDPKKFQEIASAYEEIEKHLTRPKQNRNIHIFEPNINDIFSNDLNTFLFLYDQKLIYC